MKLHREVVDSLKEENDVLKQLLSTHGIPYEADLDRLLGPDRPKAGLPNLAHFPTPPSSSSPGFSANGGGSNKNASKSNQSRTTATPSLSPQPRFEFEISNGNNMQYFTANDQFDFMDRGSEPVQITAQEPTVRRGGVFEEDPQLQFDFILAYVWRFFFFF